MAKKNTLAGLEALKSIQKVAKKETKKEKSRPKQSRSAEPVKEQSITTAETSNPVAGANAVEQARFKASSIKKRTIGFRAAEKDLEIIQDLATELTKYGLRYSEASAIRVALRSFSASEDLIQQLVQDIQNQDGRRLR